jgi:hypothetical protein
VEWNHPLKEGAGVGEPGFRVWKLKVNEDNRKRLKEVFRDVVSNRIKVKGLLYYREEWTRAYEEVKRSREQAGKRTPPRPPPLSPPHPLHHAGWEGEREQERAVHCGPAPRRAEDPELRRQSAVTGEPCRSPCRGKQANTATGICLTVNFT